MQALNAVVNESSGQTIVRFVAFRKAEGVVEGTITAYAHILRDLAGFFPHTPFADLARSDFERYLADWADRRSTRIKGKSWDELGNGQMQKTSPAYLNLIRTILKYFFKWLYQSDDAYPECVRWIKVRPIRRELDPRDILTEEDVYKLIRAAPNTRDKALIHVLYETGARINELQRRLIKDISFEYIGEDTPILTALLFIPSRGRGIGKEQGKFLRLIDSAPILHSWINEHPNPRPDQPLWVSLHSHFGERLSRSTIRKMLKRIVEFLEEAMFVFYGTRHLVN